MAAANNAIHTFHTLPTLLFASSLPHQHRNKTATINYLVSQVHKYKSNPGATVERLMEQRRMAPKSPPAD